jgi:hypothetical protein
MRHNVCIVKNFLRSIHILVNSNFKVFDSIKYIFILFKCISEFIPIFENLFEVATENEMIHLMIVNVLADPWNLSRCFNVLPSLMSWKMNVAIWSLQLNNTKKSTTLPFY